MKLVGLLPLLVLFTQCTKAPPVTPGPPPTYAEREAALLQGVAPRVPGRWTLTEVHYRRQPHFDAPAGWPSDTVVAQLATLVLAPVRVPLASQQGRPEFEGALTYAGKTYPVYLALWANPDRVVNQQGPPAYFSLEYHFPVGAHQTAVEEQFLQDVGLIGRQFTLDVTANQPVLMYWKGLGHHLQSITLRQ